jgi:hypothetical protein
MSNFLRSLSLLVALFSVNAAQAGVLIGQTRASEKSTAAPRVLWAQPSELNPAGGAPQVLRSLPFTLAEELPPSSEIYEELLLPDTHPRARALPKSLFDSEPSFAGSELRTIVEQGPAANRICLTFLGDGYTESEKERFFSDVDRLTKDLFTGSTFASYLPLFNVYAVFTPSRDSGITDGAIKKQTAFGLYRSPAGSKRAIMPGNTSALESALRLAPKTDYPIVIANDDYYGGLGGRYAITTRSIESGAIVLRHELGHNFGNVGEEYDGGQVYSGANSTRSATSPAWAHWVSGRSRAYEMKMLDGQYVWKNLAEGPVRSTFDFPQPNSKGAYWFDVQLSSVGWASADDVVVLLDGQPIAIEGKYTVDRSFFKMKPDRSLAPGRHTLEIRNGTIDRDNVLAFANVYAYEGDYAFDGTYGAFMTYDTFGSVSYRPTHEHCLMRDMATPHFCSVDLENMWIRFLDRMSLIDGLAVKKDPAGARVVSLEAADLPGLDIRWYARSTQGTEQELPEMRGQRQWILAADATYAQLVARVELVTLEVRKPSAKFKAERSLAL